MKVILQIILSYVKFLARSYIQLLQYKELAVAAVSEHSDSLLC